MRDPSGDLVHHAAPRSVLASIRVFYRQWLIPRVPCRSSVVEGATRCTYCPRQRTVNSKLAPTLYASLRGNVTFVSLCVECRMGKSERYERVEVREGKRLARNMYRGTMPRRLEVLKRQRLWRTNVRTFVLELREAVTARLHG